jgi:hypothetical protein
VNWNAQTLAVIAGLLRQDYSQLSAFHVVRLVWSTANMESPAIGGLRLLACCRRAVVAAADESFAAPVPLENIRPVIPSNPSALSTT